MVMLYNICYQVTQFKLLVWRRRQWQPAPVLLPGKSHGWRSLVGCSPLGHEESNTYWATSLSLFTFMHWRRKWQPTPVFLPGESQGRGSLVGCHLWGCTELDTTEQLNWTEKVNLRSWWRRLLMLLRINPWLRFTNASWDFHEKKYLTNWSRALSKLRFPRLFWSKTRCLRESRLLTQDQQKKK